MPGRPLRKQREREAHERTALAEPTPRREPPKPQPRRKRSHKERMERVLREHALPAPDELFVIEGAHGDPLEIFREGLALARRAGMTWEQAYRPACETALSVVPDEWHRNQWAIALYDTRTAWMRAYERRPTGCPL